jgi:4-alpha-glucanotransferase
MDRQLAALASAYGVATSYQSASRTRTTVRVDTVVAVLRLLGVDASGPAAVAEALTAVRAAQDPAQLPPTVVVRSGTGRRLPGPAVITTEDGRRLEIDADLPTDLPLGWHRLECEGREATLVVVPRRLPATPVTWGWMLQLYGLRSADSWGMGDLGDLAEFTRWAAEHHAGLVLVNPLHAVGPTHPVPASPYSPSSRRFANPLYLRVTETAAFRNADADRRAQVAALHDPMDDLADADPPDIDAVDADELHDDLIDYDRVWSAKKAALELLFPLAAPVDLDADPELTSFATYCALAERHGSDWHAWPADVAYPDAPGVARARAELADRIAFYAWLQHLCADQLAAADKAAAGMPVGIVHDLAVGVDPGGADGWTLRDVLADGARVGAPPDAFNQLGQDWGLAVWRPDRLAETGYAAYRDLLRRLLKHAGGIRVDHVAGLFRLWWIPPGADATDGTYVHYDADAMLGILALEAHRAGAVVIGEDLGTVQPAVTRGLSGRNMLSSTVLWFARDWNGPGAPFRPPDQWPRNALASISTHDLPTAYGFLGGEHVRVRAELDLLASSPAEEAERASDDRRQLVAMLASSGLLAQTSDGDDPADDDIVMAMHAALAASRTRLVAASLYDVLGEVRQPNVPGTVNEYPNWRMPLPSSLEEIRRDPRVARIAALLSASRPR